MSPWKRCAWCGRANGTKLTAYRYAPSGNRYVRWLCLPCRDSIHDAVVAR